MIMEKQQQSSLKGKLSFHGVLKVETGLHIGAGTDFAPIGAVDAPFIRDPFSKQPIIPGSSLKGKLRTLLAKSYSKDYVPAVNRDIDEIKRLFGSIGKDQTRPSRLQFFDLRMTADSLLKYGNMELDTYIGEIKFENTISRLTGTAEHPRQIERVPAGVEFEFRLVYNVEQMDEVMEDMKYLANGLKLLQMDYLGGSGTRGYGRVSISDIKADYITIQEDAECPLNLSAIETMLKGA